MARAAALEELVPAAIKSLAAHLGDGNPDGWRAALRVFELSYGKPAETPEDVPEDVDPFQVAAMSPAERAELVRRVLRAYPHLAALAPKLDLAPEELRIWLRWRRRICLLTRPSPSPTTKPANTAADDPIPAGTIAGVALPAVPLS